MRPVLVVEDDASTRRFLVAVLQAGGHRALAVSTLAEARRSLTRVRFAAALVGNALPDGHGLELVREMRRASPTMAILVVTGHDDLADRVAGLDAGADDYILRPFEPEELLARVRAHVREHNTWVGVVEQALTERSTTLRALAEARPGQTLRATARTTCDAAMSLARVEGAAVLWFERRGSVRVLAGCGVLDETGTRDLTTPAGAVALRSRAWAGSWAEPLGWGGWTVACAPLSVGSAPAGLLMLATSTHATVRPFGGPHHDLAAAIDLAAVASILFAAADDARRDGDGARVIDLRDPGIQTVFQPIVALGTGRLAGWEALTRFADGTSPHDRFAAARAAGIAADLEVAAFDRALAASQALPADGFVSVNISPSVAVERAEDLGRIVEREARPVVVEITENDRVDDYAELLRALRELRPARVSVDDAGNGFASLRHVTLLRPDFVKLDQSWTAGIEVDEARQAMVAGLVHFARATKTTLVAEGIETPAACDVLRDLGVDLGQGYLIGRPAPASEAAVTAPI